MRIFHKNHKVRFHLFSTLLMLTGLATAEAQESHQGDNIMKAATYIPFQAKSGQSQKLEAFLQQGAKLVKKTEPNTLYWYALKSEDGGLGIFDFFPNDEGRAEHFAGEVAAALNANSHELVSKGWEQGVVANIINATVLSSHRPEKQYTNAKEATYILLNAKPGMEQELEELLTSAAEVISQTEANTLLWASLKLNDNTFAIFDTFPDEAARATHFNGQVAAALKNQAEALIEGGWEAGVLENIHHFKIIAEAGE